MEQLLFSTKSVEGGRRNKAIAYTIIEMIITFVLMFLGVFLLEEYLISQTPPYMIRKVKELTDCLLSIGCFANLAGTVIGGLPRVARASCFLDFYSDKIVGAGVKGSWSMKANEFCLSYNQVGHLEFSKRQITVYSNLGTYKIIVKKETVPAVQQAYNNICRNKQNNNSVY